MATLSRMCYYKSQRKCQYRAPDGKKFQSRVLAIKYIKSEGGDVEFPAKRRKSYNKFLKESKKPFNPGRRLNGKLVTVWDEWRSDEIPCLVGWQFSIGIVMMNKLSDFMVVFFHNTICPLSKF